MPVDYGSFEIRRKCPHLFSDVGEKYGLAEWRNGRRRVRLLLHAQHEGPPGAKDERLLHAGRIMLVSDNLQAFYVRGNHRDVDLFLERQRTREFICFEVFVF